MIDLRSRSRERFLEHALGRPVTQRADLPSLGERDPAWIAVGIHDRWDDDRGARLVQWSSSTGVPLLAVAVDGRVAIVGPLTVPGSVGCGDCASRRMRAAAAESHREPRRGWNGDSPIRLARNVVTRELAAVRAAGPDASSLRNRVVLVDSRDASVTDHEFVALPRCPTCGGAASLAHTSEDGSAEVVPAALRSSLLGWVDDLTGVIPALSLDQPASEHTSLPVVVTAAPPHVVDDDSSLRRLPLGWGKGLTPEDAARSALGEAVERYSASLPDPARIAWERPDDLPGARLDPRSFRLYRDRQYEREGFPFVRFDPSATHPWVRGRWLGTDAGVWVPAVMAYLSLTVRQEHLICQGTSSGLAAASDTDEAALRATLELVERDAFLVAWMTGARAVHVAIDDSLDPRLREVLTGVEALGGAVEVLLLPAVDGVTAVMCLALGDGTSWPGATIGLGADLEPERAVRQAILELGQTGPHLRRLMRAGTLAPPADAEAVRDMPDHAAFYFPAERASAFDALRASRETIPLATLSARKRERTVAAVAYLLRAAGIRVATVDVTSPDVATGPFRVVRAVSPDLQPLTYGYGLDRRPVKRIRTQCAPARENPIHPIW